MDLWETAPHHNSLGKGQAIIVVFSRRSGDFACSPTTLHEATGSSISRTRGLFPSDPVPAAPFAAFASSAPCFFLALSWNRLSPEEQHVVRRIPTENIMASGKNDRADCHARELADHENMKAQEALRVQHASVLASIGRANANFHNQVAAAPQRRTTLDTQESGIDETRARPVTPESRLHELTGDVTASDRSHGQRTMRYAHTLPSVAHTAFAALQPSAPSDVMSDVVAHSARDIL